MRSTDSILSSSRDRQHGSARLRGGTPARSGILLVEDDDGDALLVEELFAISGAHVEIVRAQTLADARRENLDADRLRAARPRPARRARAWRRCTRLKTDRADIVGARPHRASTTSGAAIEAVGAGAQDYLVKGQIDGQGLARAVRYAVERRRADEARQQLEVARLHAEENARLERGLLPAPLVTDPELAADRALPPGPPARAARRRLLRRGAGLADGTVHAVIGDVSGHGPDAAALGVCLRIAWRTLVLGGREAEELLPTLQVVHGHERHFSWMFTTLCMVTIAPDRRSVSIRLAGHPPPLLIARAAGSRRSSRRRSSRRWASSTTRAGPPHEHALPERWSLLLYTDGLIEGRTGVGADRLGGEGLAAMVRGELRRRDARRARDRAGRARRGAQRRPDARRRRRVPGAAAVRPRRRGSGAAGRAVLRASRSRSWCSSPSSARSRSAFALSRLSDARARADRPARPGGDRRRATSRSAMIDQETGVRGYVLSRRASASSIRTATGRRNADAALARLRALSCASTSVAQFRAADRGGRRRAARDWQRGLRGADDRELVRSNPGGARSVAQVEAGKERFDAFRAAVDRPAGACSTRRARRRATRLRRQRRHRARSGCSSPAS